MLFLLTRSQRQEAQRRFVFASFLNPLGASIIIGPVIYLLALGYGASDLEMGLLYSGLYLTGLASVVGPLVLGGREVTRVVTLSWYARSAVTLAYVALPFLASSYWKLQLLIVLYLLCLMLRALGMVAFYPMIRAMSTPSELPGLLASNVSRWNSGSILSAALTYLVFCYQDRFPTEEWAFVSLLFLATLLQFASSWGFSRLPALERLEPSSLAKMRRAAVCAWREPVLRETVLATALVVPVGVMFGYAISHLKNVQQMGNTPVFLYSVLGLLASVLFSDGLKLIGPRLPSRSLLFGASLASLVLAGLWLFVDLLPGSQVLGGALLVCNSAVWTVMVNGWVQLLTARLPDGLRVETSSIYSLVAAVASLAAVGLIKVAEPVARLSEPFLHNPYAHVFLLLGGLCLLLAAVSLRMKGQGRRSLWNDVSMLHPGSLYTLLRVGRAERMDRGQRRLRTMEGLMADPTPAGREQLLESLESPDVMVRYSALRMLNEARLPEAYEIVLREAVCLDSPIRPEAVTALGFLGNPDALAALVPMLDADPDEQVRAHALKGALRLGAQLEDEEILRRYRQLTSARFRMQVMFGLVSARRADLARAVARWELARRPDPSWGRSVFVFWASALGEPDRMMDMYELEADQKDSGLQAVLQEYGAVAQGVPGTPSVDGVRDWIGRGEFGALSRALPVDGDEIPVYERLTALGLVCVWVQRHSVGG